MTSTFFGLYRGRRGSLWGSEECLGTFGGSTEVAGGPSGSHRHVWSWSRALQRPQWVPKSEKFYEYFGNFFNGIVLLASRKYLLKIFAHKVVILYVF